MANLFNEEVLITKPKMYNIILNITKHNRSPANLGHNIYYYMDIFSSCQI